MKMRLGCGLLLLVVRLVEIRQGHACARATLEGLESRSLLVLRFSDTTVPNHRRAHTEQHSRASLI